MAQKYLMAIDDSNTAIKMAEYLKNVLKKNDKVTIYSVVSNPVLYYNPNDPAGMPVYADNIEIFTRFENTRKEEVHRLIQRVIDILKPVLDKDNIKYEIESQKESIAHQIAEEAEIGRYDAIVMGKHNSSMITEFLLGSVTHKVIHLSKNIPVIVI